METEHIFKNLSCFQFAPNGHPQKLIFGFLRPGKNETLAVRNISFCQLWQTSETCRLKTGKVWCHEKMNATTSQTHRKIPQTSKDFPKHLGLDPGICDNSSKTFKEYPNNIPKHLKTFKCFSTSSFEELQLQPTLRNRLE